MSLDTARTTRRQFLLQSAIVPVLVSCSGIGSGIASGVETQPILAPASGTSPATLSAADIQLMADCAHLIVPVLDRSHMRYQQLGEQLAMIAAHDPATGGLIQHGVDQLNSGSQRWGDMSQAAKLERFAALEGSPFFGFMRWMSTEFVMREPKLWQRLGYQGSAIEHGGYLHRGFDDIDWLPASQNTIR